MKVKNEDYAKMGGMVKELGCQIVTQLIIDRYKHLQEDKLVFGKMRSTYGRLACPRTTGRCVRS